MRGPARVITTSPPRAEVTAAPAAGTQSNEETVINEPSPIQEDAPVHTEVGNNVVDDREQPLATWARVAIVVVALLAFFAVSLIATKQV